MKDFQHIRNRIVSKYHDEPINNSVVVAIGIRALFVVGIHSKVKETGFLEALVRETKNGDSWMHLLGPELLKRAKRQPLCDTVLFDVEGADTIKLHVPAWVLPSGCFLCHGAIQDGVCQTCKTTFSLTGGICQMSPPVSVVEQHVKVRCVRCQSNKREFLPKRTFEFSNGRRYAVWQCRNCKTVMLARQKTWMRETSKPECAACGSNRIALYYATTVWACAECGAFQTKHATLVATLQKPPAGECQVCGSRKWNYWCMHLPVYYKCKNCGAQSTLGVATRDIACDDLPKACGVCDGGELLITLPFHTGDGELSECPYCDSKTACVVLQSGRVTEGQCSDCDGFERQHIVALFAVNLQCTKCGSDGIVYLSCGVAQQVFEQVGLRIMHVL